MCGGSSDRPSAAGEGQSASGGEGGSKTCGRHVDGSGADNLTIAAVCAVGRGLDGPLLLVPVYIFLRRRLALFLHTSLLRTPHTGIISKTVVAAQVLARKITSLSWISLRLQADTASASLEHQCGPSLSNCSKYTMLSVKVTMRRACRQQGRVFLR